MAPNLLLTLPLELLDVVLSNFCLGKDRFEREYLHEHIAHSYSLWSTRENDIWGRARNTLSDRPRACLKDKALPDLLSFGACSKACRSAATRDCLWREREGLLGFTYGLPNYEGESWAKAEAALPADRRLPDEFVDPMLLDRDGYLELTPFQQYLSLSRFRNRVHQRLISFGSADAWSEADRHVLRGLVRNCELAIQVADDSDLHHPGNCSNSVDECLSQCTMVNCARHFVTCIYNRLEEGGVVGNVRDLIIGGIANARYPGKYLGSPRCYFKVDPPRWCKTVHVGGGPGDDHMRFEQDFCSCGAVEAFFDDH